MNTTFKDSELEREWKGKVQKLKQTKKKEHIDDKVIVLLGLSPDYLKASLLSLDNLPITFWPLFYITLFLYIFSWQVCPNCIFETIQSTHDQILHMNDATELSILKTT